MASKGAATTELVPVASVKKSNALRKNKTTRTLKVNQETSDALWNLVDHDESLSDITKNLHVLRYVDDKLYYTEDLSVFKKCDYNRDIAIKGAMKIIRSAKNCGTWLNQIVVVNPNMEIISGQNTVVAAKLLSMPVKKVGVYYAVSEDRTPELLVTGEDRTNWTDIALLKTFAKTNPISQKFYKFFIDVNKDLRHERGRYKKVTIPQLLAIVYKQPRFVYGLKANGGSDVLNNLKDFNPKDTEILTAVKIVALAQKVCTKDGIKRYPFLVGLLDFMYNNKDGITVDLSKLFNKIGFLKPRAGKAEDYYRQIKTVYV